MRIHNCHDSSLSNFNQKLRISSFCLGTISTPSISGPLQHILFLPWNPQLIFRDDQKAFIMAPATRLFHQISITASYSIHRKPEYLIINPSKIHHPIQPSLRGFFYINIKQVLWIMVSSFSYFFLSISYASLYTSSSSFALHTSAFPSFCPEQLRLISPFFYFLFLHDRSSIEHNIPYRKSFFFHVI